MDAGHFAEQSMRMNPHTTKRCEGPWWQIRGQLTGASSVTSERSYPKFSYLFLRPRSGSHKPAFAFPNLELWETEYS